MSSQSKSSVVRGNPSGGALSRGVTRAAASPLFRKLITNIDRHRFATDRIYFALVSTIAELLSDEEVQVLALYLALSPQLAVSTSSWCVKHDKHDMLSGEPRSGIRGHA
jgi:hypothetical protein